jgi:hypothetical protein
MIQEKEPTKNEAIFEMDDSAVILEYYSHGNNRD